MIEWQKISAPGLCSVGLCIKFLKAQTLLLRIMQGVYITTGQPKKTTTTYSACGMVGIKKPTQKTHQKTQKTT